MSVKRRCPKCGHSNTGDAAVCAHCKAPLFVSCPNCGTARPWFVKQCPQCAAIPQDAAPFDQTASSSNKRKTTVGDRYQLRVRLASGPVSKIYRAVDPAYPTIDYAIKELSPAAMFLSSERRELEHQFHTVCDTWRSVENPGVADIVDVFIEHDRYYVVSEFVDGWSLKRVIEEPRVHITPDIARNWGAQLCDTLTALQASHPGLHVPFLAPQNVMVAASGEIKLIDYGLTALFLPRSYGPLGSIKGYAAPELRAGKTSALTDQFAIGRLLYALLTDRLLEAGGPALTLQRAVPGISQQLVKTIARAARRDASQRFSAMSDLRRELWSAMDGNLEPIQGWAQLVRVAADTRPATRTAETSSMPGMRTHTSGTTMADLGFQQDERFGSSTQSKPQPRRAAARKPLTVQPSGRGSVELRISPDRSELTLDGIEKRREALKVRNTGTAPARVRCKASSDWLRIPEKPFALKPGKTAQVLYTIDSTKIAPGNTAQRAEIIIAWESGKRVVQVLAQVPAAPSLAVDTSLLDFGAITGSSAYERQIVLRNTGGTRILGTIGSRVPWLVIDQQVFAIGPEESTSITVRLAPEHLKRGRHDIIDAVLLDSDAGQEKIAARVLRRTPKLHVDKTALDLGEVNPFDIAPGVSLMVANSGDALLTGVVQSTVPWLSAYPAEFTLGPGEAATLDCEIDVDHLDGMQAIEHAILIETNAGKETVSLRLDVLRPHLDVRTALIDFGTLGFGQTSEQAIDIANTGRSPLDIQIATLVPWLRPNKTTLSILPKQSERLVTHLDPSAFASSASISDTDALSITSPVGSFTVKASVIVQRPELVVEPETLDFGYIDMTTPVGRELQLTNSGTGTLSWQALPDKPWVEFSATQGQIESGQSTTIRATAYGMGLEKDSEGDKGTLIINSDGGRAKIPMIVGVASPRLSCHSSFLDLGESINRAPASATFRLFNYGMGKLTGTLSSEQRWLVLDHLSFSAPTGRSVVISATTDMDEFPADSLYETATIHIESNGGNLELEAALNIMLEPDLIVVDNEVRLGAHPETGVLAGRLVLLNQGMESAHVELVPGMPQLVISRAFCDVKPGKRVRIALQWQGEADWDDEKAVIRIVGDDETLTVPVIRTNQ